MKQLIGLLLNLIMASGACAFGRELRTDINPALQYYQAFLEASQISEADRQYLMTNEWRGQVLDQRFGDAVARYHYQFRLLRAAVGNPVPCDWGVDLGLGPEAVLPALAPAKSAAYAAGHRIAWSLQNGKESEARDDFIAAYILGRQVSRDGVLISALVQIAIENILYSDIAWNYGKFSAPVLQEIMAAIEKSPPRGTIAATVPSERIAFLEWLLWRSDQIAAAFGNESAAAREELRTLLTNLMNNPESEADLAVKVLEKSGGAVAGVQELIRALSSYYDRVEAILKLPPAEFGPEMDKFMQEVEKHANPFIPKFLVVFANVRQKEFAIQAKLAMVQAAVEYKLHGAEALNRINDPFSGKPFAFQRFVFQGVDRGFKLQSAYRGRGFDEVLIFVEKDGPPFMLDGKNAGKVAPSK